MPITVPHEEMDGSPKEERTRDGFRATRELRCAWADRLTLRDQLLTFPGHSYPHSPIIAYCTSVSARPVGHQRWLDQWDGPLQLPTYEMALVTAQYETSRTSLAMPDPGSQQTPPEMISESIEPTSDAMRLDASWFRWGAENGDALTDAEAPVWVRPMWNLTFTRHHLPTVPAAILNLTGCVNQTPLVTRILGLTFAAETLLFQPPNIQVVTDSLGARKFTVTYRFTYNRWGWNWFYRAKTDQFSRLFVPGVGQWNLYPLANFSNL